MARTFTSVGVVGLGTMGAGIAEIFARNCYRVVGVEVSAESLERGRQHVQSSTARAVARGKLSEAEQAALLERVTFTTDMASIAQCELVVEAVVEQLQVKKAVIGQVDRLLGSEAVIATN